MTAFQSMKPTNVTACFKSKQKNQNWNKKKIFFVFIKKINKTVVYLNDELGSKQYRKSIKRIVSVITYIMYHYYGTLWYFMYHIMNNVPTVAVLPWN